MNERYRHYAVVDGEVLPLEDMDAEGDDDIEFTDLNPDDQEYCIEIIDNLPHHGPHRSSAAIKTPEAPIDASSGDHQLPLTAQELEQAYRSRKLARRALHASRVTADERERPYAELGGQAPAEHHRTPDELLETVVTGAETWMRDVHDMLRYAIPELTPEAISKMTHDDQKLLALHFQGLWDRIPTAERMIGWGHLDHQFLTHRYGKSRNLEELTAYLERLEALSEYLEHSRAAWTLRQTAYDSFHSKKQRDAKYSHDRERYGDIYVAVDKKGKYRVKRLKAHDS